MSRTVLDLVPDFLFVMQSFVRKKKKKEEHKTLPSCLKSAKIAKLGNKVVLQKFHRSFPVRCGGVAKRRYSSEAQLESGNIG